MIAARLATEKFGMMNAPQGREHVAKKSKVTEEQIACALKQAELETRFAEVCRKLGISEATFYLKGEDVVRVLKAITEQRGLSQTIKTDYANVESFNGRLRQECLKRPPLQAAAGNGDVREAGNLYF